ncbi:MAG TPA: hypothetical protein VLF89_01920 [Candidatus Saccharimonadales bacterium]|nr:hypothetical protein [Candidatus Saccharimonadales bacterium]
MNKGFVDSLVQNMKKAEIITKASPWVVEGIGEKQMHVRYVGIKPFNDWLAIIPEGNNLLLKFVIDKQSSYFELFLANKPPFIWMVRKNFTVGEKWEPMLGEIKRRLHHDKTEFLQHRDKVGNLYGMIVKGFK